MFYPKRRFTLRPCQDPLAMEQRLEKMGTIFAKL
jgi:hypothetical protein